MMEELAARLLPKCQVYLRRIYGQEGADSAGFCLGLILQEYVAGDPDAFVMMRLRRTYQRHRGRPERAGRSTLLETLPAPADESAAEWTPPRDWTKAVGFTPREVERLAAIVGGLEPSQIIDAALSGGASLVPTRESAERVRLRIIATIPYLAPAVYLVHLLDDSVSCHHVPHRDAIRFESRTHPLLRAAYERWYATGRKIMPPDTVMSTSVVAAWIAPALAHTRPGNPLYLPTLGMNATEQRRRAWQIEALTGWMAAPVRVRWNGGSRPRLPRPGELGMDRIQITAPASAVTAWLKAQAVPSAAFAAVKGSRLG